LEERECLDSAKQYIHALLHVLRSPVIALPPVHRIQSKIGTAKMCSNVNMNKVEVCVEFCEKTRTSPMNGNRRKKKVKKKIMTKPPNFIFHLKKTYCHSPRETEKVVRFSNARKEKI